MGSITRVAELKQINEIDEERVERVRHAIWAIGRLDITREMLPFQSSRRAILFTSRLTFHTNAGRLDINLSDGGEKISLWAFFKGKESPRWVGVEEFEQEITSWIEARLDSDWGIGNIAAI